MARFLGCALAFVLGCTAAPPISTCIPGSTAECACAPMVPGVQTCTAAGAYAACLCPDFDAGGLDAGADPVDGGVTPPDAPGLDAPGGACTAPLVACGGRCVDTSTDETNCGGCADATHTCATGSFCVSGTCQDVGSCPPPFVMCTEGCIDPRSSADHCGASGACTGGTAGAACTGACLDGECVYDSCESAQALGATTSGVYVIDADGSGPARAGHAYCDMTTAGGGWTLVYRIRNDIPDIVEPWWAMVGLGSGESFPSDPGPLVGGAHFDGPTREIRSTFAYRNVAMFGSPEIRVTMIELDGSTVLDVRGRVWDGLGWPANGNGGTPSAYCVTEVRTQSVVISAAPGLALSAGANFYDCYTPDQFMVRGAGAGGVAICGDASVGASRTTLFWIRTPRP